MVWKFTRIENDERRQWCAFLDPETMKITEIALSRNCVDMEEMTVRWAEGKSSVVEVGDENHWIMNVVNPEGIVVYNFRQVNFGGELLVQYYRMISDWERMRIWKMGNPPTLLHDRTGEDCKWDIYKVDEQFIVTRCGQYRPIFQTLYFISTETLQVITSLSVIHTKYDYSRGLLFQFRDDWIVRILDVASGTHFSDVRLPFRKENERSVRYVWMGASSNSEFMAIGWIYLNKKTSTTVSHLSVYDLEAVKKPNSDSGSHLLFTLQFQFIMQSFVMNEGQIAFNGTDGKNNRFVTVLNFANFAERKSSDFKENPEEANKVKMKIIYEPFIDSFQ